MDWEEAIAAEVRRIIESANHGSYPLAYWEWVEVARRFGLDVVRVRAQRSFAACLIDDLIAVNANHEETKLCRWIAHEITESILRSESGWPICIPHDYHDAYHRIALLVEAPASPLV